jgi:hypothetical protein
LGPIANLVLDEEPIASQLLTQAAGADKAAELVGMIGGFDIVGTVGPVGPVGTVGTVDVAVG